MLSGIDLMKEMEAHVGFLLKLLSFHSHFQVCQNIVSGELNRVNVYNYLNPQGIE